MFGFKRRADCNSHRFAGHDVPDLVQGEVRDAASGFPETGDLDPDCI